MRMFIGFVLLALGTLGLLSIVRGNPSVFAPVRDAAVRRAPDIQGFADAGGFIGTLGAYPLTKVVSPAGAFLVDLGLAVIGALIMTGTSFAELGRRFAASRASFAERAAARRERRSREGRGEAREAARQGRARRREGRAQRR